MKNDTETCLKLICIFDFMKHLDICIDLLYIINHQLYIIRK